MQLRCMHMKHVCSTHDDGVMATLLASCGTCVMTDVRQAMLIAPSYMSHGTVPFIKGVAPHKGQAAVLHSQHFLRLL